MTNGVANGTFDSATTGSHADFRVLCGTVASGQFRRNLAGNSAFERLRDIEARASRIGRHRQRRDRDFDLHDTASLHVNGAMSAIRFELKVHEGGPLWDGFT
jgi:hypothetical protein